MIGRVVAVSTAVALLAAGCGSDGEEGLSRVEVEKRVAQEGDTQKGDNIGSGRAKAECVERAEERKFRCEVQIESSTSFYDVLVSKDGERIQLIQR